MKCGNTIVLVLVGVAIFGCSTHPIGVDFKKQPERYVSEEVVLNLVSDNKKLSQKVSVLENDYSLLKEQLENQIENNKNLEQRLDGIVERLMSDSQHNVATGATGDANTETLFNITRNNADVFKEKVDNKRVKRQEGDNIAFSAYVAHEVVSMGKDQIVQFQNVLLNDGYGYNNYTGVFTVPRSGVYMLIFFVEDFHDFQSIFHLVVNKNIVSSAIADPIPKGQNIQGGNVVLVHLNAGESVWVSAAVAGDDIEGYSTLRTSTFSGYLVYE